MFIVASEKRILTPGGVTTSFSSITISIAPTPWVAGVWTFWSQVSAYRVRFLAKS